MNACRFLWESLYLRSPKKYTVSTTMAVLEKIRSRAGLLVGVIALALFSFVVQGLFDPNNAIFGGRNQEIGEINGHSISGTDFQSRLTELENRYKENQGVAAIDENLHQQFINQVWTEFLDKYLFDEQLDDAGVAVSDDELFDMVQGDNIDPQVQGIPLFQDSITRQFDRSRVIRFIRTQLTEENDPDGNFRRSWAEFEQSLQQQRRKTKYNNLLKKALYVTTAQAKRDFMEKTQTAEYRLMVKRYTSVPDSAVIVIDSDIRKYYDENKHQFEQPEETRRIEYVVFNVNPTDEDRQELRATMDRLKSEFAQTSNDTVFVNANSEEPFMERSLKRGQIGLQLDSAVFAGTPGTVFGPFVEGDNFKLLKLRGFKANSDSVRARHILISPKDGLDMKAAMAKADSLRNLVKSGSDFAMLAMQFSDDQGSKIKGGDLGWFTEGMMVPTFNDASFNGKPGDLVTVESQFGAHLIHIQEKTRPVFKAQVVYLTRPIVAGSRTVDELYAKANDFAVGADDYDAFVRLADENGYAISKSESIRGGDRSVNELANARELVQWAFNPDRELNEVSKVFDIGGSYVVVAYTGKKDKGIPSFDQLKESLRPMAIRAKKAEQFSKEFTEAMAGVSGIDALASKMNLTADTAMSIYFSTYTVENYGFEPKLVGSFFGGKPNALSKPVEGNNGVYVFWLNGIKGAEVAPPTDWTQTRRNILSSLQGRSDGIIYNAILRKGEVEDKRSLYF